MHAGGCQGIDNGWVSLQESDRLSYLLA